MASGSSKHELDVTERELASGEKVFGRYTLQKILGRGGMGIVWLAHDEELEREVALKFLPELIVQDRATLNELKRETKRSLELTHKNIVRIHDFVHDERSACISMEYVDGDTLSNLRAAKEAKVFEPNEIALWTSQLCDALDYAHNYARIIHRDLKPSNLMVNQRGNLKVSDFGIARSLGDTVSRLTAENLRSGTLVYMSPQQLEGERGTHLDDIYSLGATLYDLLTSHPPFYSGNIDRQVRERAAPSMTERRKDLSIEPASVAAIWEEAVAACLAKDPAQRPQSTAEVANRLQLSSAPSRAISMRRPKKRAIVIGGIATLVAMAFAGWYFGIAGPRQSATVGDGRNSQSPPPALVASIPEKSIAVLPFENLSSEKENAYFAEGVQDEVLTYLAKVADLKVISRTSVMNYGRAAGRDLRQIGKELGVAHLLEGGVQRAGKRVRVNAKLIDARTGAHLWARTYDRDLTDVFAIQSEIAAAIAEQLQAKLSPNEKAAIARSPTTDVTAFDLYIRAQKLLDSSVLSSTGEKMLQEASDLLNQAVARDPSFFQAYCLLARVHDYAYWRFDHTAARLAAAQAAVDAAFRLQPDAGEAHMARAWHFYHGYRDYERALIELEIAGRKLPNDPRIFELTGYIRRRQGDWEKVLANFEQAVALDPRNSTIVEQSAGNYFLLRRYPEAAAMMDRALAIDPATPGERVARANVDLAWKADTRPMHKAIDSIRSENPAALAEVAGYWLNCALAERDPIAAAAAMAALGEADVNYRPDFDEGLLARMSNDKTKAEAAFTAARKEQEKLVQAQPEDGAALSWLGVIDAGLGRKEEALREGRRAIELSPVAKYPLIRVSNIENLAIIAAWVGEKELACEQLEIAIRLNGGETINYGQLKLHPYWDPLRGEPCFEKIVQSLAPK